MLKAEKDSIQHDHEWISKVPGLIGQNVSKSDGEAYALSSAGEGLKSASDEFIKGLPFRYTSEALELFISEVSKAPNKSSFKNLKQLVEAMNNNKVRKGQFIYGAMKISELKGGTKGEISNCLTSLILLKETGKARKIPCFHVAVYVGKYKNTHFVVENPGMHRRDGIGYVTLEKIECAFHNHDERFFAVSPIHDDGEKSTRYLVVQRALACVGLQYKYHIRNTNCECFALSLMGEWGKAATKSLRETAAQAQALPPRRAIKLDEDKKAADEEAFKNFFGNMKNRIRTVPYGILLTLEYFVKKSNYESSPLPINDDKILYDMITDYNDLFEAIKTSDIDKVKKLMESGLFHAAKNKDELTPAVFAEDKKASKEIQDYLINRHRITSL